MEGKLSDPNLDGSGQRAMRENEKAIAEIEKEMASLSQRASSGEIVDSEVLRLKARYDMLKEDQGRIVLGGM